MPLCNHHHQKQNSKTTSEERKKKRLPSALTIQYYCGKQSKDQKQHTRIKLKFTSLKKGGTFNGKKWAHICLLLTLFNRFFFYDMMINCVKCRQNKSCAVFKFKIYTTESSFNLHFSSYTDWVCTSWQVAWYLNWWNPLLYTSYWATRKKKGAKIFILESNRTFLLSLKRDLFLLLLCLCRTTVMSCKCMHDLVYHGALRLITNFKALTHHCLLYEHVGWSSLAARRLNYHYHNLVVCFLHSS